METTGEKAIARVETSDVLEIQQVADTYSTLITAVREGDVATARRHSLAAHEYDPNALQNLDVLDKVTTNDTLTLAEIGSPISPEPEPESAPAPSAPTASAVPSAAPTASTAPSAAPAPASAAPTASTAPSATPAPASDPKASAPPSSKPKLTKQSSADPKLIALTLKTCTTTLISGWLNKKPQRLGLVKKKWVKLCADPSGNRFMLFYFTNKDERKKHLGGSLPITGLCELKRVRSKDFILTLESGRAIHFIAKNDAERQKWMSSLEECISKGDRNWALQIAQDRSGKPVDKLMDIMTGFVIKRAASKEFRDKDLAARIIQRLFRNAKKTQFDRLNDQLVERMMSLNADVERIDELIETNTQLEGEAWTFEHEYDYKQLLKQHESLQDLTAIGVNLSFVREIASAKGSEYNALGVQKNKKNDHRTNMGLCKDYLAEAQELTSRTAVFEKILLRENTILLEIGSTAKVNKQQRARRRSSTSIKVSFQPALLEIELSDEDDNLVESAAALFFPETPFSPGTPPGKPDAEEPEPEDEEIVPPPPNATIAPAVAAATATADQVQNKVTSEGGTE